MISYKEFNSELLERIKEIYTEQGWNSYLNNDEKLVHAFQNSLYVLGAFDGEKLVGFIRCVGDGEHIVLVQDLIVDKQYQRKGIGSALFKKIWTSVVSLGPNIQLIIGIVIAFLLLVVSTFIFKKRRG